jgi:hypothetical protein
MTFGTIILYTLLGLYGLYCISFIGTLFYTIYKEREEERRVLIEVYGFIDSDDESLPTNP